ncbi:hypothetical protein [Rathayibacter sp. VKM Ac-2630]|jgi:hypothetical protein|uniref:hypothetical protein n=1 Tax=Rathayibacter sp. VKM Ac-2630 TaxID=1938617 RepID=UPI000980CA9D|nr:hypothetical protein [Rathayibacter sp. VKM Ac-2630]OOB92437.1 hypothetical protein B0T42_00790 [Rathayibacter sp. VKM Ac-2630]
MPHRSAAIASVPHLRTVVSRARQRAAAELLAHLVVALAFASVLLLAVSASFAGLLPAPTPVPAFEAWSLMRTSATLQIGVGVLATALAALAKAAGCGSHPDRWCIVAALSAAGGALLLVAPPV